MIDTEKYKPLLYNIIGASMEVHNTLGKGLLESVYQEALAIELAELSIPCVMEQEVLVFYKKRPLKKKFRLDLLVADDIVVELKSVAHLEAEHRLQLCNYLRLTKKPIGLLINFGSNALLGERWIYDEENDECFIVDKNMKPID